MPALLEKTNGILTVLGEPALLAEDLYGVNGSIKFLGVAFPLRMTIIRLPETRDLIVYSPFDPALVDTLLQPLGTVKAVVAPNSVHSSYAQSFTAAHSGSTLYSSPALANRFPDRDWGTLLDESCSSDVISPHVLMRVFTAFKQFQEVVLLHKPSGSVIAADLVFNFPPSERAKMSFGARLFVVAVRATRPLDWSITVKLIARRGCKEGLPQMDKMLEDWEWDRFVPCHGAVVETDAKATFRNGAYRYVKRIGLKEETSMWKNIAEVAVAAVVVGVALKWQDILVRQLPLSQWL